jgi:phosphatidylserine/phosphatidylglycerophosphate/cardiolipin synthase-like enzyme
LGDSDWFLTQGELDASRDGHSRSKTGILDGSSGNEVTPLINGQAVMASLLKDINSAGAGDSIHMTAFVVNGDVMLDPTSKDPEATKITAVLTAAMQRNVSVRILVNENVFLHSAFSFCRIINAYCRGPGDCCVPETRHHSRGGSVHSKQWTFIYASDVVSYLGSMDIQGERWDTSKHDDSPAREKEPTDMNHFFGWHGGMFRMRGPVALDAARHFHLQWNDPAPISEPLASIYTLAKFAWNVPNVGTPGNISAQLVRTLSCAGGAEDGYYQTFAPRGEYSFAAAFKKMVSKASHYIYIEDQFVFYEEALQAVADALPHVDMVVIVTDNATAFRQNWLGIDVTMAITMRSYHQRKALDLLMKNASNAAKVHIFELARPGYDLTDNFAKTWIYTHAKAYFVDDEYMLVGSHGIEQTGWTNDIEVSLGVTDGTAGPDSIVGQYRRKIWAEFLKLDYDDPKLMHPSTAVDEFERQAALGNTSVRHYYPPHTSDTWRADQFYKMYEPEGRCKAGNDFYV